jgi:hypothetical protein
MCTCTFSFQSLDDTSERKPTIPGRVFQEGGVVESEVDIDQVNVTQSAHIYCSNLTQRFQYGVKPAHGDRIVERRDPMQSAAEPIAR